MNNITFDDIYNAGVVVITSDTYIQYHLPTMPLYYDSNYISFQKIPSVAEFQKAEHAMRLYHSARNQHHLKFTFPQNERLSKEVIAYLTHTGYDLGFLELYVLHPKDFPKISPSSTIKIQPVTKSNLEAFLHLQRNIDEQFGKEFAMQKEAMHRRNFTDSDWLQVMAYSEGEPAGSVDLIIRSHTVEIDGLHVLEYMRHKGVGSHLQNFVMEHFPEKVVILVADGEDTAKDMYLRQNYQYIGYQYEAVKA